MTKPDTPFPKHWLYYIVLKYAVIALAVVIALYLITKWRGGSVGPAEEPEPTQSRYGG